MFALLSLLALGCERENPGPPDSGPRRDSGVTGDAGTGADAGADPDAGIDTDAGAGTDAGPLDGGCVSGPTCWSCPPLLPEHFLNACTGAACEAFPVTTTRLPRLRSDGTVPPLP